MVFRVLIPVGELRDGEEVRKTASGYLHTVAREVKIHDNVSGKANHKVIKAEEGTVFLRRGGDISSVLATKEVFWKVGTEELRDFLDDLLDDRK